MDRGDTTDSYTHETAAESTGASLDLPETLRIVGIGSSAGGLEALRAMIENLPDSDLFAYVIAQHLSPSHASVLAHLLAPKTLLKVQDVVDGVRPEAGTVYITVPNKDVIVSRGLLRLTATQQPVGPKPSVNHFFATLAHELGDRAIGIILSGTGTDGAAGLRAIKAAGGITIVQEPDSAKYDGMPKAAIHTGSIDLILRPEEIGPVLKRIADLPGGSVAALDDSGQDDDYAQIANVVRIGTAFRLADYKSGTVRRRIARRMSILGILTLKDYLARLRADPAEPPALVRDTFISVTGFFRDDGPFESLNQAIRQSLARRPNEGVIRCWVPGCATGEEAFSIAMIIEAALADEGKDRMEYVIFASDLDDQALEVGRRSVYPLNELEAVPADLRARFVDITGGYGAICKSVRSRVIFARQNVIEDPPFARLDLISCRNLLIYLTQPVQLRLMQIFHFSLNPDGLLLLGKAENAESHRDLFKSADMRARLYRRVDGAASYALPSPRNMPRLVEPVRREPGSAAASTDLVSLRTLERLAARFAPASVVINDQDKVIHFQGDLKPFLNFPQGRGDWDLFDMISPGPRPELRALIYRCRRDQPSIEGTAWQAAIDGKPHLVRPVICRLEPQQGELLLVSFCVSGAAESQSASKTESESGDSALVISELEKELASTRSHLNLVVEELETSNEELQSLNEELQSTNEELQSTNEQLQTSNEELQSTNEELLTVNEELQVKTTELEVLASDLSNVQQSLSFPLMVIDQTMRIARANDACGQIAVIDAPLEGRSLNMITWTVALPNLVRSIEQVIETGDNQFRDVPCYSGKTFVLHLMPYRNARRVIDGAVLLFEDVTIQTKLAERSRLATEAGQIGIWEWFVKTDTLLWDNIMCRLYAVPAGDVPRKLKDWQANLHREDTALARLENAIADRTDAIEMDFRAIMPDGAIRYMKAKASIVRDLSGSATRVIGVNSDETEMRTLTRRLEAEKAALQAAKAQIEHGAEEARVLAEAGAHSLLAIDESGQIRRANSVAETLFGYEPGALIGMAVESLVPEHLRRQHEMHRMGNSIGSESVHAMGLNRQVMGRHASGELIPLDIQLRRTKSAASPTIVATIFDLRPRIALERELREAKLVAEMANEAKTRFLATMSHEIRTPMNVIFGMLQLMTGPGMSAQQLDFVAKARAATTSLRLVVDDILDYAKVESGKLVLEQTAFSLRDMMTAIAEQVSVMAADKDIEVLLDLGHDLPALILGDPLRLQQILFNLASNAVKFTEQGMVTISAAIKRQGQDSVTVAFSVDDTGIGVAQEKLKTIFDSFTQAEASTTRRFGGTGLGLSISSGLVELMGGTLDVESTPGQGSRFHFTLDFPVLSAEPETPTPAASAGALRILVVDDNAASRDIIARMAQEAGWHAETEDSGEAAIARLQAGDGASQPFDVVLLDWKMPGLNGWETARRLRALGNLADAPILALMSAYDADPMRRQVQTEASPFDGFLTKPVSAALLVQVVEKTRHNEATRPEPPPEPDRALAGLNILLAEDQAMNQFVARKILEAQGAAITIATNGAEVLEAVRAADQPFDLVLMDIQMPGMDGYEATRCLRGSARGSQLPILAVTANAMLADREKGLACGMNDTIAKPFETTELIEKILLLTRPAPDRTESRQLGDAALIDRRRLDEKLEGLAKEPGKADFIAAYFKTVGDLLSAIDDATSRDDAMAVQKHAHDLAGSAGIFGALALCSAARKVDSSLRSGQRDPGLALARGLSALGRDSMRVLHELLGI